MEELVFMSKEATTTFTSTKCINNDYLFNAVLGLVAIIQNAVTFFK